MKVSIGIVGLGYWGPNLARNFNTNSNYHLKYACDLDITKRRKMDRLYPSVQTTPDYQDLLSDPELRAICICTPVHTHYKLARMALQNGKHVLVEKPITSDSEQVKDLIKIAKSKNLVLMCDHTFCYHSIPKYIKDIIENRSLGDFLYLDSTRVNLGLFQSDINVIWDLMPHDLSIVKYLFPDLKITSVSAHALDLVGTGKESIAYVMLFFDNGKVAHFHLNWLSPVKIRQYIIGFSKKMIVWDDTKIDERIKIYDKGIDIDENQKNTLLPEYRNDGIFIPKIDKKEALVCLVEDFRLAITDNKLPVSNATFSLEIVQVMEAITKSFQNNGMIVKI